MPIRGASSKKQQNVNITDSVTIIEDPNTGEKQENVSIGDSKDLRNIVSCLIGMNEQLRKLNIMIGEMSDIDPEGL